MKALAILVLLLTGTIAAGDGADTSLITDVLFRKAVSSQSPDYDPYFDPEKHANAILPWAVENAIECAGATLTSATRLSGTDTYNAFVYDGSTGECKQTTVSPIAYFDPTSLPLPDPDPLALYVPWNRLTFASELPSTLFAYWLFGNAHMHHHRRDIGVIDCPRALSYFEYTQMSPIPSFSGLYAPTFEETKTLTYQWKPHIHLTSFAMMSWFRTTHSSIDGDPLLLLTRSDGKKAVMLNVGLRSGSWQVQLRLTDGKTTNSGYVVPTNSWYYVGCTYDHTTGYVDFISNGSFVKHQYVGLNLGLNNLDRAKVNVQPDKEKGNGFSVASVELHTAALTPEMTMDIYLESLKRNKFH